MMDEEGKAIVTYDHFYEYCMKFKDTIYVREQIDGRWKSVALGELSLDLQLKWIRCWWDRGHLPYRILE